MSHERIQSDDPIEIEIDAFMAQLPDMLEEHEGKWTIFVGGEPLGFWDSPTEALTDPSTTEIDEASLIRQVSREYQEFGRHGGVIHIPEPFFVRLVKETPQPLVNPGVSYVHGLLAIAKNREITIDEAATQTVRELREGSADEHIEPTHQALSWIKANPDLLNE